MINNFSTAQEIFDHVVSHLFTQGVSSSNSAGGCFYRHPDGLSCAVGCIIPDSYYHEDMDHSDSDTDIYSIIEDFELPDFIIYNKNLLRELQVIHDQRKVFTLKDIDLIADLKNAAEYYGLTFDINKFKEGETP